MRKKIDCCSRERHSHSTGRLAGKMPAALVLSLSTGGTYVGGFEPEKVKSYLKLQAWEESAAVISVGKKP